MVVLVAMGLTVTVRVVVVAHCPAVGVNVYVPVVVLLTVAGAQVPVTPSVEVPGSTGATAPLHMAGIAANNGVMRGLTVIESVTWLAHNPAVGVNVYVAEVVLLTVAGDHVPLIPLLEVVGKTGAVDPLQKAGTGLNTGVPGGSTVIDNVVVVAHCPAAGVNVYTVVPVVAVLTAGFQVPVMGGMLVEFKGKTGAADPWQTFGSGLKVGTTLGGATNTTCAV